VILVDTSVWIDYLKGRQTPESRRLQQVLDEGVSFGINELVYGELLAGARDAREWATLGAYFSTQRFYSLRVESAFFEDAARIFFDCRRKGITLSGLADCLIAQNALDHDVALLHCDADFPAIAKVRPLRLVGTS
jgi:predicted nucleic acid-binding protein